MDKTSLKVLRYIKKQDKPVSREAISQKYGIKGEQSLSQLDTDNYISQGSKYAGITKNSITGRVETKNIPNGMYVIEPKGRDFLEHKFWSDYDKWITRITALFGFITGIISLVLHFIGQNAG